MSSYLHFLRTNSRSSWWMMEYGQVSPSPADRFTTIIYPSCPCCFERENLNFYTADQKPNSTRSYTTLAYYGHYWSTFSVQIPRSIFHLKGYGDVGDTFSFNNGRRNIGPPSTLKSQNSLFTRRQRRRVAYDGGRTSRLFERMHLHLPDRNIEG
jgi:hypothetical protein